MVDKLSPEDSQSKIPALALLSKLGYRFMSAKICNQLRAGGSRATDSKASSNTPKYSSQVVLLPVLRQFLAQQTFTFAGQSHHLSPASIDKMIANLQPAMNLGLLGANQKLYQAMVYGITVTEFIDGKKASPTIALIDWQSPDNNYWHVTDEMAVLNSDATGNCRPDIVAFVNGLPLIVIEAKKPDAIKPGESSCMSGVRQQIRNQGQQDIPHLFAYSQLLLAINGHEGLYGTCGTKTEFWAKWTEKDIPETEFHALKNQPLTPQQMDDIFDVRAQGYRHEFESRVAAGEEMVTDQDRLIVSLLRPDRFLEMMRLFMLFDKKVGKIVARHQQVFGVKETIRRIQRFERSGRREGGVLWHTTGSGKSFTMVFFTKALIWLEELARCRLVVVTDRVDLEDQLSGTFATSGVLTDRDQKTAMATSGEKLAKKIGKGNQRVIFTIINKFAAAVNHKDCFNDSPDLIVLVDEGHRSQNGENNIRMQQMLPNAAYIAFTGTPLLKEDKTQNKFGKIIHAYPMQEAVDDKAVTPLLYEERVPELNTNAKAIDAWFDRITDGLTSKQVSDLKRKYAQKGHIYKTESRIELIAYDIYDHYLNFKRRGLKAQLACDSKSSAIRYKAALDAISQGKAQDKQVTCAIVISAPDTREGHEEVDQASEDIVISWWRETVGKQSEKAYSKQVIKDFENKDEPHILIVVDKLLTGFDEPKNTVLYIDKPLRAHNLIQAIARVNRLHAKKDFGYLIDYRGILKELDTTIKDYQDLAQRTQAGYDLKDLAGLYQRMESEYKKLPGLHKALWAVFAGVKNKEDKPALRRFLAPKIKNIGGQLVDMNLKKREDFDEALKAFSACMKVALQSASYFNDVSFNATRDRYKKDLKDFVALRQQVREDADETINYDDYAEDIKSLLDKHIAGIEVKASDGAYRVDNLGKSPVSVSDEDARSKTAAVTGRVTRMIEQDLADDPYAQEYFSKLLKQAIEDTQAMFDAPVKQYLLFADLEQQVQNRTLPYTPPKLFDDHGKLNTHAQAYYGLFLQLFDSYYLKNQGLDDDKLAELALKVDELVKNAVAEFSLNPGEIENAISRELLLMLFRQLGTDNAKQYLQAVLKIVRLGLARGKG